MKTPLKSTTVLLVDDEQAYRQAVSDVLHSQGYTVVQAASAAEALRVLEVVTPELIVLDVMMPEVDGLTLLRQLASDPRFVSIPIVMASAKAQPADRWSAWERGASAYLAKPFTFDEVTSLVEHLLSPADSDPVPYEMAERTAVM